MSISVPNSVCWKFNVVIAGIRLVLVLGFLNAVMPHIDFEAREYDPNSRKMGALVTLPFKRIGKFTKCNTFRSLYVKFLRGRK